MCIKKRANNYIEAGFIFKLHNPCVVYSLSQITFRPSFFFQEVNEQLS